MAKVKAINYLGKQDVYNMEVEARHNFSINGGLIVHNCGYGLVAWHARKSKPPDPEKSHIQRDKEKLAKNLRVPRQRRRLV